jgi:hypothetical protein
VKISLTPFSADLSLRIIYKEPMLGLAREELRFPLVRKILSSFECRLDDLKFDPNHASGNFIQFSRYYGSSLFGLNFGLEETSVNIFKAESKELALDICEKLSPIMDEIPIGPLRFNVSRHFTSKENINSFLTSLNPSVPDSLGSFLAGRGVFYRLQFPDLNLIVFVTVVNSLLTQDGLFVGMENQFLNQTESFRRTAELVLEKHEFILHSLGINVEENWHGKPKGSII